MNNPNPSSTPPGVSFFNGRGAKTLRDRLMAAFIASITGGTALQAATIGYDGGPGGTGTDWGDPVNWVGDVPPTNTDTAFFGIANTTLTVNLGTSREVSSVTFSSANTAYTIGSASDVAAGNSLTLGHIRREASAGGLQTIAANVVLSANSSVWDINLGFNNGILVTGTVSGASKSINKWGAGNLTLGAANTFNGGVSVNLGTLTLDFNQSTAPTSNIIASSNTLTIGPATLAATGKAGNSVSQTFASSKLDAGASNFTIANGNTANTRTLVNLGAISRDIGTTANFTQPTGTGNTAIGATNGYVTSTGNDASGILGGWATVGTEWATNNGTNIVAYTGYTDLTGAGPTIANSPNSNIRISGSSTGDVGQAAGTTTVNTIRSSDAAARTITVGSGNTLRVGSTGGILATGAGGLTIGASGNAGFLTAGGADNTAGELFLNNTTAVTVNSVITDNGSGQVALVKAGSGTATLNAAATNTGGVYVNAGLLQLTAGTDRLSTTSEISVYGGSLNLGGSTQNHSGSLIIGGGGLAASGTAVSNGGTISNGTINKSGSSIDARGGTLSATITGTSGINKTTAGALALGNTTANTFTGATVISEGAVIGGALANVISVSGDLIVGAADGTQAASYRNAGGNVAFSSTRNLTVYANGSINFGSGAQNVGLGGATINIFGGTVGGSQVYQQGTVNMTAGTWAATTYGNVNNFTTGSSADTAYITGALNASTAKTFNVADGSAAVDLLLTGNIASSSVTKAGTGVMQITGNKGYGGTTTISAGTLAVDTLANGGVLSSTGTSSSAASNLLLRDGSTFRYTGSATSTDRLFTVGQTGAGQSATLEASGSGAVSFTNTGSLAWGTTGQTRTLILGGANTGDNSIAASIGNNGAGAVSLTKNGGGKWILAGNNSYTGATTVNAGTLLVNGSLGNSTVDINGGAFGGTGVVGGAVNVNSGGTLAPGASIESLNVGSVSFASNSTFALEIDTNTAQIDLLNVSGSLSITGGAILTLTDLGTNVVLNTTLTIIDYSATWNGGFFTYNGNELADGETFSYGVNNYTINYDDGTAVTLTVAAIPEPGTVALAGMALGWMLLGRRKRA